MHHLPELTKPLLGCIMGPMKSELASIEKHLQDHGLLMVVDNDFPSYVTMITKEPIKGSWWGHSKGNFIYNTLNEFLDRADIVCLKLLNQKTTLITRAHWSALISLGVSEDSWQMKGLKPEHLELLGQIQARGEVRTDDASLRMSTSEVGKLASRLEEKLLVYSEHRHTESGKHVRVLLSWPQFLKERSFAADEITSEEAQMYFEFLREDLGGNSEISPHFPWE